MRAGARTILLILACAAGASSWFLTSTVLGEEIADVATILAGSVGFAVAAVTASGFRALRTAVESDRRQVVLAAVAGGAAFGLAPYVVLTQRASDAPPGSETVFFTTAVWGAVCVLVAQTAGRTRTSYSAAAGAVLAVVGAASLLASWEFPSSFSPFVRFPRQVILMMLAGVVFAVGSMALSHISRHMGFRRTVAFASSGAVIFAAAVALTDLGGLDAPLGRLWPLLLAAAAAQAVLALSWIDLAGKEGVVRAASSLLITPAALTTFQIAERLTIVRGPDPVTWRSAGAGIALSVLGAAVVWLVGGTRAREREPLLDQRYVWGGLSAALFCVTTLALPAVRAEVTGVFGETYHAVWSMPGIESAAGWLVGAVGLIVAAAVLDAHAGRGYAALAGALVAAAASAAYPFLAGMPLRTATRWIPADVQQTYGTEYAHLTFDAIHDPVRVLALVAGAVVAAVVAAKLLGTRSFTRWREECE